METHLGRGRVIAIVAMFSVAFLLRNSSLVSAKEVADTGAPSAPISLMAGGSLSNQLTIKWDLGTYDTEAGLGYPDTFVVYRTQGTDMNFAAAQPLIVISSNSRSYTDMSVQPDTLYHYKVAARLGEAESANSPILNFSTSQAAFSVTANALDASKIQLMWNNGVPGTQKYTIYRSTISGNEMLIASTTDLMYTDSGLLPSTQYVYHIKPLTMYGEDYGAVTNAIATLATGNAAVPLTVPPAAPPVLQGNPLSPAINYLSWNAVNGATSYALYRSSLDTETLIGTTTNLGYSDLSPMSGLEYIYFVKAYNELGAGPSSNRLTLKTATPAAPTVTGQVTGRSEITLSWPAVFGAQSYKVYRSSDNRLFILAGSSSSTTFTDKDLGFNQYYYYYVKAKAGAPDNFSQADESSESATVSVRTLDANTKLSTPVLKGRALSLTSAELSWAPVTLATHYRLRRDYAGQMFSGIGYFPVSGVLVTGTTYIDTQAFPISRYTYDLVAIDAQDAQSFSSAPVTVEMVAPTVAKPPVLPTTPPQPTPAPAPKSTIVFRTPALGGDTTVYVKRGKTVRFTYAYTNPTSATQLTRIIRQFTTLAGKPVKSNGDATSIQTFGARRTLLFYPAALSTTNVAPGLYRMSVKIISTKKGDNNKVLDQNSFLIQVEL